MTAHQVYSPLRPDPYAGYRRAIAATNYPEEHAVRTRQLEIIPKFYATPVAQPFYLPDFWVPVDGFLENPRKLNVSFYRKLAPDPPRGH
jgi:hypothetical protein